MSVGVSFEVLNKNSNWDEVITKCLNHQSYQFLGVNCYIPPTSIIYWGKDHYSFTL